MDKVHLYKGIEYTLPPQPPKKQIRGSDLPQKKQKWFRTELPENFEELPIEEQEAFALQEDKRCTEGFWFMCNGVPTYITGDHYFYLNWFKIDSGYPDYRDRDRRWFYHWELCSKDEQCLGQAYGKLRRDGYSYRCDSIVLNRARKTFNAKYGIISKTGDDAKEMFNKLVHGFMELPQFFKPQVASAEDIKNDLWLKTPQQKVTFKNRVIKKEISLNTLISWKNTKENSFDGWKLQVLCADESGKFPKDVSIEKWFNIGRTCLILGSRIIGKMLFGSTVNELEKGGEGFKSIWDNSDTSKMTENGRTISGLWRYFVPAIDGMEGFIDEFGQSVIETPETPIMGIDGVLIKKGARQWLEAELKAKKDAGDMVGYYEMKRQFPIIEDDMFINPSNDEPCWNISKIYQQIEYNKINLKENDIVYGYLDWEGGNRESNRVVFYNTGYDDSRMRFGTTWIPKEEEKNRMIRGNNGKVSPANSHLGLFSLDPYSAMNVVDKKRGSKAASHGFFKYNMLETEKRSEAFFLQYWKRLDDPLMVYEDMIKQCVYFGMPILGERNKNNWSDYFRGRGFDNYCLLPPKMSEFEFIKDIDKQEDVGLSNSDAKRRSQMIEYLAWYIQNYIGYNDETGRYGYMPFEDTLKDWLDFDHKKWTPYDLTISTMLCIVGSRAVTEIKKKEATHFNPFPKFNLKTGKKLY